MIPRQHDLGSVFGHRQCCLLWDHAGSDADVLHCIDISVPRSIIEVHHTHQYLHGVFKRSRTPLLVSVIGVNFLRGCVEGLYSHNGHGPERLYKRNNE